jgi:hypothetical protein
MSALITVSTRLTILGIIGAPALEGDATSPAAMHIEGQDTKTRSPDSGGRPDPCFSILEKADWNRVLAIV